MRRITPSLCRTSICFAICASAVISRPAHAQPPRHARHVAGGSTTAALAQGLRDDLHKQLDALRAAPGKFAEVVTRVDALYDMGVRDLNIPADAAALTELAEWDQLLHQLTAAHVSPTDPLVPFLLNNPNLAASLALWTSPKDNLPGVFAVLRDLHEKYPDALKDGSPVQGVGVAICLVDDKPREHPTLGPAATLPGAADVFGFYNREQARMLVPLGTLPIPLLTYIVDVHASVDEMQWALDHYTGNRLVAKLYSSIVYDTAALKHGLGTKKIFDQPGGYTLQNIKKVGGVCAEQAYFASEVGKAIGVPSTYVHAANDEMAHAYVGFVSFQGRHAAWDFSTGRYKGYKNITGLVTDPQTGEQSSDQVLAVTAGLLAIPPDRRDQAAGLTLAAERLGELAKYPGSAPKPPAGIDPPPNGPVREADTESRLKLLEAAVRLCPAYVPAWAQVTAMAKKNLLTDEQKRKWAQAVMQDCGQSSPDFAFSVMAPMIRSVTPADAQSSMWDWAVSQFRNRTDLVAAARFEQGELWKHKHDSSKALQAYNDVVMRFANDSPMVIDALTQMEALLGGGGHPSAVLLQLYQDTFRRTQRPSQSAADAFDQSNYFKVGARYAELLDAANRSAEAARIRRQIGMESSGHNHPLR